MRVLVASLFLYAGSAWAAPGQVRLSAGGGMSSVAPPFERRLWGTVGEASAALALGEQTWFEIEAARTDLRWREPPLTLTSYGGSLVYQLDVLAVAPYIGVGMARVNVALDGRAVSADTVTTLSVGFVVEKGWLLWGVGVRYYALFDSDVLAQPAYATVFGRLGVLLVPTEAGSRPARK